MSNYIDAMNGQHNSGGDVITEINPANKITLQEGDFGTYLIVADDGRDLLIQTDWDFPGTARSFGWDMREVQLEGIANCEHDGTDGTITCPRCGLKPMDFINAAREWLDDNIGAEAEDPGYFGE